MQANLMMDEQRLGSVLFERLGRVMSSPTQGPDRFGGPWWIRQADRARLNLHHFAAISPTTANRPPRGPGGR